MNRRLKVADVERVSQSFTQFVALFRALADGVEISAAMHFYIFTEKPKLAGLHNRQPKSEREPDYEVISDNQFEKAQVVTIEFEFHFLVFCALSHIGEFANSIPNQDKRNRKRD